MQYALFFYAFAVVSSSDPATLETGRCGLRFDNEWICVAQAQIMDLYQTQEVCEAEASRLQLRYPGQAYAVCVPSRPLPSAEPES